jgi:hypothetical protein
MPRFANFNRATRARTPDFAAATAIDNAENQRRYDRNMALGTEGIEAYGEYAGDRTLPEVLRSFSTHAPMEGAVDTVAEAVTDEVIDTTTDAGVDAAAGAAARLPIASVLRGGTQIAKGDVKGALGTAAKAGLATLGPAGWAAGAGLGLLGI